ncbi:uncharacterized protein LOC131686863 [Topomyia yanbarensis]|uniref:uncharacterized protein LOC131686863 n=1 Tax=Topomyia yanbarensis TaxID=2498891 RepID=UPI00273C4CD0|nr:uncharacterized protein LOC131686863 [Topomyia yanbarensis]
MSRPSPRSASFGNRSWTYSDSRLPLAASVLRKRKVISYITQIFDPLGLVGPTIIKAKFFMQRLWALKQNGEACEWDMPLPSTLQDEWKLFHNTLHLLSEVRVPRFISMPDTISIQLHFFCDASEHAYGTYCYVRTEAHGAVLVQLLTLKSKVAPLSTRHTTARLELCAAYLSTQLYKKLDTTLRLPATVHFWTDSTTVLQRLSGNPSRWKTFVANLVSQIQLSTDLNRWKHVPGVDNPTDDISRGLNPTDILNCTRWWTGTPWLSRSSVVWPNVTLPAAETPEVSAEGRKIPLVAITTTQLSFCTDLFARYSNFSKLRQGIAFIQRYLHVLCERASQRRSEKETLKPLVIPSIIPHPVHPLTAQELQHAELSLCHLAEGELFAEEISDLASGERVAGSSTLKWLNPFVGLEGTVRVGGRLRNAVLTDAKKHTIVLSAKHPLAVVLPSFHHLKLLHAGPQLLLSTLRQKFWILGGRNLQAHTSRTEHSRSSGIESVSNPPFSVCGVHYCGPFYLKSAVRNRGPTKVYVAIFVCFSTKAVHIEAVSDLSTPAFLAALRRLVTRRGKVVELHSDNATAFKGASNALNRIYRMLKLDAFDRNQIFDWCSENEIRWKFIPPRAPHFGSLWEAAVKSARIHLLKAIGNMNVVYEDMLTLLAQTCLNSRPLTPIPDDPSDLEVLILGHFLVGSNLQAVPEADLKETPDNRLNHWELTQKRFQTS